MISHRQDWTLSIQTFDQRSQTPLLLKMCHVQEKNVGIFWLLTCQALNPILTMFMGFSLSLCLCNMAESFAFAIADRVLGKLGSALIQEVGLAWGVKTELEELNDTLSTIRAVLLDAEEKQATSHQLRDWLGKLKDGFYDAEDIVDEFEYEALRQKVNVSVIPIVGIGGLGKTTLAGLVYNDERVVGQFSTKMWVCVSDEFDIEKLVKKILKEIRKGDESYSDSSMVQLQKIKGLCHDDCLSLFVKCSFRDGEDEYPNLLKIGDQIVEKCAGVPLAVRSLGSLLYSKRDEWDWVSIRDSEIWELEQNEDGIMAALRLSYYDLPYHLKQCFALCSVFAKDFEFSNVELISTWMAEGLIHSSGQNAKMEDIGERYINELLSRSFFQDVEQRIPGVLYTFKMHDLVHDLAMFFAQPECLTLNFHKKDIPKRVQHAAFSDTDESFVKACILRFKCIRRLDLQDSNFEALPNSIGSLKHLRYLNLSGNKRIKKLPNSICKLYHLQFLTLFGCSELEELPRGIWSMISLRTVSITMKQRDLFGKEKGLRSLNSLQHLQIVDCLNLEFLSKGMESLIQLRILVISDCPSLVSLSHNIKFLTALEVLVIDNCQKLESMDGEAEGQEDIQSFGSLQILFFGDLPQLEALPRWLLHGPTSNTLHQLHISNCPSLRALPESGLQKLVYLQKLEIEDCPELIGRCKTETGEDWQKIAHIPKIYLDGEKIASFSVNTLKYQKY
ncbi:unnamed protein product, partial [Vitis vinifera]|uniref:Disease resistance protein RGA3 n=1 Tax=Vitis vinifera TaxID=29760 RepID=D7SJ49_VITVI